MDYPAVETLLLLYCCGGAWLELVYFCEEHLGGDDYLLAYWRVPVTNVD